MQNAIETLPRNPENPENKAQQNFHLGVLDRLGLGSLVKFCQSQGGPNFVSWDTESNLFKIAIPFPELDTSIAKTHLKIAKSHHLLANIEIAELPSNKKVQVLSIGTIITPNDASYSAFQLSIGLEDHPTIIDIIKDAYADLYETKTLSAQLPPINILENLEFVELPSSTDFTDITDSSTAVLYTTAMRASLAIPLNLVDETIHEELKDILTGIALEYGGRPGKMESNDAPFAVVQIPKAAYNELKAFALNLGLKPATSS